MGQELTIKNVNKSFEVNGEKINVLNDINLDIKEGEFVVLVGHSGCGKSTLLKIIAGLEKNDTGLVAAGSCLLYTSLHSMMLSTILSGA